MAPSRSLFAFVSSSDIYDIRFPALHGPYNSDAKASRSPVAATEKSFAEYEIIL